MQINISNIHESDKYNNILNTSDPEDTLYLLYPDNDDRISLSVVNKFQQAKCKVQFLPIDHKNESLYKAFLLGKIFQTYKKINIVSDDETLNALVQYIRPKTAELAQETTEPEITVTLDEKRLRTLCAKLSNSEISLTDHIDIIKRAVNNSIGESESFGTSIKKICDIKTADLISDAFMGYENELFSLIQ